MFQRRRVEVIGGGILLLCWIGLAVLFFDRHLEYSFITYRYAQNFAAGRGLVFNPGGKPVLSGAVSPAYAILLAMLNLLTPNFPALGNLTSILAIGAGGIALVGLIQPAGKLPAILAAGVYLTSPLLWASLGLETPLWLAAGLAALWAYNGQRSRLAAAFLAIMVLIRLEALVLAALIVADAFASRKPLRLSALGVFGGIAGLGGLILVSTYTSSGLLPSLPSSSRAALLPDTIGRNMASGLMALAGSLTVLSWVWIGVLLLCAAGVWEARHHRVVILLGGWTVLHLIVLGVLQVGVYVWSFAPLVPLLAALAGLGMKAIAKRLPGGAARAVGWGLAGMVVAGAAGPSALGLALPATAQPVNANALAGQQAAMCLQPVADWLRTQTPAEALTGARGVGTLGYLSRRSMVDYYGTLQSDLGDALERGDGSWWIAWAQPDYLVLSDSDFQSIGGYSPADDEWFAASYAEVARFPASSCAPVMIVFQRTTPARPMHASLISFVDYGGGLTLNGIASDFSLDPLEGGRMSLIRLEWLLTAPVPDQMAISIRIQARQGGALAGLATRTVDFSGWPVRKLITTYHPIHVADGLPPGIYDVQVGIGPDANNLGWKTVGRAKVPFVGATDLGGIAGAHSEFGDIELIGYRVGRRETGLEVLLLWRAIHAPMTDYRVLIQVRDPNGSIAAQQAVQPYGGAYPTSVWSAGEQVTDSVLLDVSAVPSGDYDVYVGLLNPDDSRILTLDGKDAVFIGRVNIAP